MYKNTQKAAKTRVSIFGSLVTWVHLACNNLFLYTNTGYTNK